MDIVRLLTREETIAGMEVCDTHIRIALFRSPKKGKKEPHTLQVLAEEELEKGVISEGVIINAPALEQSIRAAIKKTKTKIRYVVLTLSGATGYHKVFSFPKNITPEKLEEGMRIVAEFQLPHEFNSVYADWEDAGEFSQGIIEKLLVAAKRETVDAYITLLSKLNIHVIAVETHPQSIARILQKSESTELFVIQEATATTIFITYSGVVRFVRTLPKVFFDRGGDLAKEIEYISDFYESEFEVRPKYSELKAIRLSDSFSRQTQEIVASQVSAVFGAAFRGVLPRNTDSAISLMPVGTEEAYELEKARVFAELIGNICIAVLLFFVATYAGAWLILVKIQQNSNNRLNTSQLSPLPQGVAELQERTKILNAYLAGTEQILSSSPQWSVVIDSIQKTLPPGVRVHSVDLSSYNGQFSIAGIAPSRPIINSIKSALNNSEVFTGATIPPTNLDKTTDIPFSVTLSLKNPSSILFTYHAQ